MKCIKKLVSTITAASILLGAVPDMAWAAESIETGASDFPRNCEGFIAPVDTPDASAVRITNAEELAAISQDRYASYVLMNDIDLSEYGVWEPIGTTLGGAFCGKFDGQGHTISGLEVSESFSSGTIMSPSYVAGLFGVCDGAQIKNLFLKDAQVSISTTSGYRYGTTITEDGRVYAGAIAGYALNDTVIYNCHTSGSISAQASGEGYSDAVAGGMIGEADSAIISYCYNTGEVQSYNGNAVEAYNAYTGGVLGRLTGTGVLDRSYNAGEVTAITLDYGVAYAGGLTADTMEGNLTVTDCYNAGAVQGQAGNWFCDTSYAGGIAAAFSGSIDRVYDRGTVTAYTRDPYGISPGAAWAGGICGNCDANATIKNAAVVEAAVSANATGEEIQYRIAPSGIKSNTITIDQVAGGSVNDAVMVKSIDEMKTEEPYVSLLGWDFDRVWKMEADSDFPQLRQVEVTETEYQDEYVTQHLEFIDSEAYADILENYRWAQIYWSQENNFKSNTGEFLYDGAEKLVNLLNLDFAALFEDDDPFKVILADYIADQGIKQEVYEITIKEIPFAMDKIYEKVKGFIAENWKDGWGELSDEDLFWLFHYEDRTGEEWINSGFEEHLSDIVYGERESAEKLGKILGASTTIMDEIFEKKKEVDTIAEWMNGLFTYSAMVQAYVTADKEFKEILERMCENLPDGSNTKMKYKAQLKKAIESYTQYNDSDNITARMFGNYLADTFAGNIKEAIFDAIKKQAEAWITACFTEAALAALKVIGWAADVGWKISEYITKNGELQECREMLRANAYFEETMYFTLLEIEQELREDPVLEKAQLFDAAYKFLKETELYSMDTCMAYMDTYQTAWLHAIRNMSKTFMSSAIEEVQINKLFLYNSYCHGMTYLLGGKIVTVACPTDVFVYDEQNELAVSIEGGTVTACREGLFAFTVNAVKVIALPLDQTYSIEIKATGNGSMDYSISEYGADCQKLRTTIYADIPIQEGERYAGTVSNSIEVDLMSYQLKDSASQRMGACQTMTEEDGVPVEQIVMEEEKITLQVGERYQLLASVQPDEVMLKSVAWVSADPSIAAAAEDGTVAGVSVGTTTITAYSVYGGAEKSVEVAVVANGEEESVSSIHNSEVNINSTCTYTGSPIEPEVEVKMGTAVLEEDVDYTLEFSNNINAGTEAKVTVTGIGNYTGSLEVYFTIEKADQTLTGTESYRKREGDASFKLDIRTDGDGALAYESSDPAVAAVSADGTVTIVGAGSAVITVAAEETGNYNAAEKKVEITVAEKEVQPKPVPGILYGDVNADGTVDAKDAALLRRAVAGWEVTIDTAAADVDADGTIGPKDAALLRRAVAGWEVKLGA